MSETRSIVVEYDLPQAPEKVWRALTEPALVASWLMESNLQPVVGHRFTFRSKPDLHWDGVVRCEVLEVDPLHRLRYTWNTGEGNWRMETVVTWTLTATATGGTKLELVHDGFAAQDAPAFDGLGKGWRGHVGQRLREVVATV